MAYKVYADGYTLVVNGLEWRSDPVQRLCRGLESDLGRTVGVDAYATPEGSQGFSVHFDDHDVLILQIDGSKHWDIYPPRYQLPREEKTTGFRPPGSDQLPEVYLATPLEAGNLLYLPRG